MQYKKLLIIPTIALSIFSAGCTVNAKEPVSTINDSYMNETTNYKFNFRAANGTIYCGAESQLEDAEVIGVECFTRIENEPILPRGECELEWGESFFVGQNGKASLVCSSDFPFNPRATILKSGESIKGDGWQCTASESTLTCTNRDKHGVKINKQSQELF